MRILTVEDEESTANVIRMLLENKLEAVVDTAPDCASAGKLLSSDSYDLITVDYQLPDGDGLSLLEEIVKMAGAPPVIIVTGHGDEHTAVSAFKLGASGYVVKDENMSTLLVEEARSALARAELKGAENELLKLSNNLRQRLHTVSYGILTIDPDRVITSCNRAATEIFGYSEEELLGQSVQKLYRSEEYFLEVGERLYPAVRESGIFTGEIEILRPDGEVRLVELSVSPLISEGELEGVIGAFRDITESKQAEEVLINSERQLALIFDNVYEVLFYLSVEPDNRYRFLSVNDAFLKTTGLPKNQVVGKYVHEVIPEPSLTIVLANYRKAVQDNTTVRWEEVTDYPAGRKYGDVAVTPIVDTSGRCTNLLGSVHDVTGHKRDEEELHRVNEELEGYAQTVSHDLKGPLSSIAVSADVLSGILERERGKALGGDAGETLSLLKDNAKRALRMTDNLLVLARAGQAPATCGPVDISGVVRSILKEKEALLKDRGVQVSLEGALGVAAMDRTHAYQVFSNLIGNAVNYNDSENPEIHISRLAETESGALRYLVRDNGAGIPEGAEEDIFLPFHKGPNSTETGIGLTIVDKVVGLYGGEVCAYNDGGACFKFTLPIYSSQGQ